MKSTIDVSTLKSKDIIKMPYKNYLTYLNGLGLKNKFLANRMISVSVYSLDSGFALPVVDNVLYVFNCEKI